MKVWKMLRILNQMFFFDCQFLALENLLILCFDKREYKCLHPLSPQIRCLYIPYIVLVCKIHLLFYKFLHLVSISYIFWWIWYTRAVLVPRLTLILIDWIPWSNRLCLLVCFRRHSWELYFPNIGLRVFFCAWTLVSQSLFPSVPGPKKYLTVLFVK